MILLIILIILVVIILTIIIVRRSVSSNARHPMYLRLPRPSEQSLVRSGNRQHYIYIYIYYNIICIIVLSHAA